MASLRRCKAGPGQKIAKTTPCKVEWTPARSTLAVLRPGQKKGPNLISSRSRCLRGAASMGAAVSITRLDLTASELRKAASGEKNSAAARRILALALVLDGVDRKTAAETCGMDRQTLRDWVHRYNAAGLFAISNRQVPDQNSRRGSRPNWPSLSRPAPTPRCTGSCVGGGSICATNCSDASVLGYTSVRSARFSPSSATANCRSGPATHRLTEKPRRCLKKLRRDSHGANPRPRQRQADRNLVPR